MSPVHWGLKKIDGLFVPPGKAYTLLTDHLITGTPLRSELAHEERFQVNNLYIKSLIGLAGWLCLNRF